MKEKTLAIVGCGKLGGIVAEAVANGILSEYKLIGLYSRTRSKAEALAARMPGTAPQVCNTIEELRETIATPLHGYWYNHTCFGGTETIGNSKMKERQTDVIIINAIAPILYVYGKHRKDYALCGKAEEYLHNLKCEENGIVRRWREQGIKVDCAADSQALLHLNKSYCSNNKCRQCQFAYVYIKSVLKCL